MTMQSNTAGNGAQFITKKLQKEFQAETRTLSKFRQFRSLVINQGLNKGVEANWVIPGPSAPTAPMAEGGTVPVQDILTYTGSCTIKHFISGRPFTKRLSQVTELDVNQMVRENLANACAASIEIYSCFPALKSTNLKAVPTGGTSATDVTIVDTDAGAFSTSNGAALTTDHLLNLGVEATERNIELLNGEYVFIARPKTFIKVRKQLDLINMNTPEGLKMVHNGTIGKYDNINCVEQTTVPSQGWAAGLSDSGFMFGANSIVEVLVDPEHIISNSSVNWGQDLGLAYTTLVGHSLVRKDKVIEWASAT